MRTILFTALTSIALAIGGWSNERITTAEGSEGVGFDPLTQTAVVANQTAGTISIVDVKARQLVDTIEVGGFPVGAKIDQGAHTVIYTDKKDGTVVLFDMDSRSERARLPVGANPSCVGLAAGINTAVVASIDESRVSVIDLTGPSILRTIEVGPAPICMHWAIDPQTLTATVVSAGEGTLQLLDIAEGTVLKSIPVGNFPVGPSRHLATNTAIVPLNADNAAAIVDLTAGEVLHTVPTGAGPICSVVHQGANVAFVSNLVELPGVGDGSVSVIDMSTGAVIGTIDGVGEGTVCMGLDEEQGLLMVSSRFPGDLWLIDIQEYLTGPPTAAEVEPWGAVKASIHLSK